MKLLPIFELIQRQTEDERIDSWVTCGLANVELNGEEVALWDASTEAVEEDGVKYLVINGSMDACGFGRNYTLKFNMDGEMVGEPSFTVPKHYQEVEKRGYDVLPHKLIVNNIKLFTINAYDNQVPNERIEISY
ncbi:hypothetical protein GR28A_00177 [Vibrio phage vB_VcorM_GR28A]|nr:hypothetical protein GR28A_00177 [Vibrio phage vB_VcorM_GR28A]